MKVGQKIVIFNIAFVLLGIQNLDKAIRKPVTNRSLASNQFKNQRNKKYVNNDFGGGKKLNFTKIFYYTNSSSPSIISMAP